MTRCAGRLFVYVAILFFSGLPETHAQAENRVALVIGNGAYATSPLRNPVNDAQDMAAALRGVGFEVIHRENASRSDMRAAVRDFSKKIRQGGVGLFYFAGHGVQVENRNYLIPVDANIEQEYEVADEALDADSVLRAMGDAENHLNIIILDACRNNPFARSFRSGLMGLAPMDAPKGSLISFATAPGSVAADGDGKNGIYTKHLLKQIKVPNLEVGQMMRKVRVGVQNDTNNRQTPYEVSSLTGNFYFSGRETEKAPSYSQAAPTSQELSPEEEMWKLIKDSKKSSEVQLFINTYPEGKFVRHAELKLARLNSKQIPVEPKRADKLAKSSETKQAKDEQEPGDQLDYNPFTSIKSALTNIAKFALTDKDNDTDDSGTVVNDRFALEDGTVHDLETGLMWASADNGSDIDWEDAEMFCRTYNVGDYTDWRLPTLKELQNLQDASVFGSFQVISLFDLSACCLWSSDRRGNIAANYYFSKDQTQWALKVRKSYSRVLPVRDIKY
ncbi:MAG: caspase family protein [Desulfobulbaceae bacterium]|nr:caspase family protein [Desulfobulbaceae bacterium]